MADAEEAFRRGHKCDAECVCCCGDSMLKHGDIGDGHGPTCMEVHYGAPGPWRASPATPPADHAAAIAAARAEGARAGGPLVYLACPYSHPDRAVRVARFEAANRAAGDLMAAGHKVFSPISHTHPIAEAHDLPRGWDYWEAFDRAYLGHSNKVVVLRVDGWRESKGVQAEIAIAAELGLPVEYIDPAQPAPPLAPPPTADAPVALESLLAAEARCGCTTEPHEAYCSEARASAAQAPAEESAGALRDLLAAEARCGCGEVFEHTHYCHGARERAYAAARAAGLLGAGTGGGA